MKRSPFLKTWLALAVLGGLFAYIFLVENKKPAGSGDGEPKQKLFSQDAAQAKQIRLEPRGGETIVVERHDKAWSLTAPQAAPADAGEAEALLSTIRGLELDEVVAESGAKLAEFGLEPPQRSVSVTLESGAPLALLLGNKTADGSALYAKTPGSPRVFTLPAHVEASLSKSAFDLRDRDLLHVKRDAVKQLLVAGPGESYALARGEDGEWAFTRPLATRAGRWAVDGLLGTLEGLRMDRIAAEAASPAELSKLGFDKPARSVTLTLADGSSRELQIGSSPETGRYHARVQGSSLVAVIPGALVDDLAKGMGELRMKRVADVATFDVQGFDVAAEGKKSSYAKSTEKDKDGFETSKWKRTAPDARELDRAKVEDALFKLAGLEVQEFVDAPGPASAYGLDAPALSVTIRLSGGKPPLTLEIGEKDGSAFSRRPADAAVLKLDAAKVAEAKKELLGL
ncbi:MAG: DUF4340 domain-containing protein [Vicinamibacteria bacterium]